MSSFPKLVFIENEFLWLCVHYFPVQRGNGNTVHPLGVSAKCKSSLHTTLHHQNDRHLASKLDKKHISHLSYYKLCGLMMLIHTLL